MKYRLSSALIVIVGVFLAGAIYLNTLENSDDSVDTIPSEQLDHNAFETEKDKLVSLLDESGLKASLAYAQEQLQINPSFARDCHPLLHQLGHASYSYFSGFEEAMENADELCNSGFIHGLIEANFEAAPTIDIALNSSCTDYEVEQFKQWQCFHGVGHGIMYKNGKDHTKSVNDCSKLRSDFAISSCINGVFMEEFIVVNHSGNQDEDNYRSDTSICQELSATSMKAHCYFYAPTAFLEKNKNQFLDAVNWCEQSESSFRNTCVSGVGAQTMKDNISNPSLAAQHCKEIKAEYQSSCVSGAISLYINHHASSSKAKPLCVNEFNKFEQACNYIISDKQETLNI